MSTAELHTYFQYFTELLARKNKVLLVQMAKLQELVGDFWRRSHTGKTVQQITSERIAYEKAIRSEQKEKILWKTEEDIQLLQHHIEALRRIIERKSVGGRNPFARRLSIEAKLKVGGKTRRQVVEEISAVIRDSGIDPQSIVLRYFTSSREDVLRVHGTDKSGDTSNYRASDFWNLEQVLQQRGLRQDDGFYALPFELMIRPHDPFPMIRDFLAGKSSIGLFDRTKLIHDSNMDYIVFNEPKNKLEALMGIITAAP